MVEHDEAELRYDGQTYRPRQRRLICNAGNAPITRYLIRISVDRYPGDPDRSNLLYREDPLTWDELGLTATHDDKNPMGWSVRYDRDALKELWLCFENERDRFPLYPGERAWIEYSYTVSDKKWGSWYQRAVRLPTEHLTVRLVFPSELQTMVWGTETTMTAEAFPFRTAFERDQEGDDDVFTWSTDDPPLHARYRLEWRFRQPPTRSEPRTPSETMSRLGIVQEGDPILREVAPVRPTSRSGRRPPSHRPAVVRHEPSRGRSRLRQGRRHRRPPDRHRPCRRPGQDARPGPDHAHQPVGSKRPGRPAVRGLPQLLRRPWHGSRPRTIHVEHQDADGTRRITIFDRGHAGLVAQEIDHLNGILYTDRMPPGREPIPVSEYRQGGQQWSY